MILIAKGTMAYRGMVEGFAVTSLDFLDLAKKIDNLKSEKYILVCDSTTPEFVPYLTKFVGLVAAQGGILSHTAIVARELKIPAIVGISSILSKIKDNDYIFIKEDELWKK